MSKGMASVAGMFLEDKNLDAQGGEGTSARDTAGSRAEEFARAAHSVTDRSLELTYVAVSSQRYGETSLELESEDGEI